MSVNKTTYIVQGWRLPYDIAEGNSGLQEQIEKFEDENRPEVGKIVLISDGMNGAWRIFGKIILLDEEYEGEDFKKIEQLTVSESQELFDKYVNLFGVLPKEKSSILFFNHYH